MYEALFNLVNVWSLMLWPLMLADKKGVKVKNKFGIYLGTQVLSCFSHIVLPHASCDLDTQDCCCSMLLQLPVHMK